MKQPLNYAILRYVASVEEACAKQVYEALKPEFGNDRRLKVKKIFEALQTAEKNGLLEESRYELDQNGDLVLYFAARGEGLEAIKNYLG